MRKFTLIFIALVLSACSLGRQSEVQRNQQKWQDAKITHYRYNLSVGCFCVFNENMPLVVEVKDGNIVSMKYQNGKDVEESNRELFERYATIDKIFAAIEKDFQNTADTNDPQPRKADKVVVKYDVTYGFPTMVNIDFIKQAIDDELALTLSNLERLP